MLTVNQMRSVHDPTSLLELEAERHCCMYSQLPVISGAGRSENWRRCGKPNCVCAQPDHPGHGPRFLWTRAARGRGTVGRPAAGEVERVRQEVARHAEFAAICEQIAEVNEKICEARPAAGRAAPSAPDGAKGLCEAIAPGESSRDRTAGR